MGCNSNRGENQKGERKGILMKKIIPKAKNNVHDYPGQKRPVVAVYPGGKIACPFDSIKEAVDKYGFSRDGITNCCRGRQRLCGGLNWFYKDDFMFAYFSHDYEALNVPVSETRNDNGTFKKGHHNMKGRKRRMTPEYLENRRANMRRQHAMGLLPHDPSRNWKPVVEIGTGRIFQSIRHAAKATGYTNGGMSLLLRKGHKSTKTGYRYCLKSAWDRIKDL